MIDNEETPLGQEYEEIINDMNINNTNQSLKRHICHRYPGSENEHNIGDFILKRADYTNTFININTEGLPNNATLYLVDENSNQLYSPVDSNGHWVTTRCSIVVGQNNIIPLPAQFTSDLSSHMPFPAGTYNWKLQYPEDDYFFEEEIPLEVEIRDFKVWDILTPQIYPNENIQVKMKTYGDTLYPRLIDNIYDMSYILTSNATFDVDTGIITYPNSDINNLNIGKHTQVINQANECTIDYEIKNPIQAYIGSGSHENNRTSFNYLEDKWFGIYTEANKTGGFCSYDPRGCADCFESTWRMGYIDGANTHISVGYSTYGSNAYYKGTKTLDASHTQKVIIPPGTYFWNVSAKTILCQNEFYHDSKQFTITTEDCSIVLTLEYGNENNAIGHFPNINTLILNNQTISSQANYGINPQRASIIIQKQNYQYEYNDIFLNLQLSDKNRINIRPITENASLIVKNNDNTYTIYPLNTHGYTMIKNDNIITLDLDDNIITVDLTTQYIGLGTNSDERVEIQIIEVDQISSTLTATYLYNNETPIKDATIYIKEFNSGDIVYTGITNENGEVKIDWSKGRYQAIVQDAYTNKDLLYSNIIDTENPYLNNITIFNSDLVTTYGFNTPIDEISINNYGDLILTLDSEVNNIISNVYIGENGELYYRSE